MGAFNGTKVVYFCQGKQKEVCILHTRHTISTLSHCHLWQKIPLNAIYDPIVKLR